MRSERPRIAVVIPTLNEEQSLGRLLAGLGRQQGVELEIFVSDGESHDATLRVCEELSGQTPQPIRWARTSPGRGRQLNAGARATAAPELLFLHADTELTEPFLLAGAAEKIDGERARRASHRVAGHFGLSFRRSSPQNAFAYHFFEAKTRLDRTGCINGDQGLWLSRRYFEDLGGFDESLPFLEDSRLAAKVFATGVWITLPGSLLTSARRFEAEGFAGRQLLNVLIRAFEVVDPSFFVKAAGLYRGYDRADRLDLWPFFKLAHQTVNSGPLLRRAHNWYRIGAYARTQGWQVAFALDCLGEFLRKAPPGSRPASCLERFDRWFDRLTDNAGGRLAAGLLAAVWFYGTLTWLRVHRRASREA